MLKKLIIPALLVLLSGASNGLHETLLFHYPAFKAKFPGANKQYWNPFESWKNKYKDYPEDTRAAFPGAKTIFVVLTDAKHLLSETHRDFLITALLLLAGIFSPRKWWAYLLLFIAIYAIQVVGFHIVYSLIF